MISIISDFDSVSQIRRRLGSSIHRHPILAVAHMYDQLVLANSPIGLRLFRHNYGAVLVRKWF
jgi:hypothetical protein